MAITTPFAQNGDKKEIPQTSSDGSLSFDKGFGSLYALPPEEGGLFIDREQFNQLVYQITEAILANQQSLSNLSGNVYNKTEVDNKVNPKADKSTTYTKGEVDTKLNAKANANNVYNKGEVDTKLNGKANANAVVNLSGNQTIRDVKTFLSLPVCNLAPTANNQVANKAYVDSVGNSKVATTTYGRDKATFATKTELNTKANQANTYTKAEVDSKVGKAYITETYSNGASWYRVWSDKWCEQGGKGIATASITEVALLKPYKNTNYSVITNSRDTAYSGYQICIYSRTATAFSWYYFQAGGPVSADWVAYGYIT